MELFCRIANSLAVNPLAKVAHLCSSISVDLLSIIDKHIIGFQIGPFGPMFFLMLSSFLPAAFIFEQEKNFTSLPLVIKKSG